MAKRAPKKRIVLDFAPGYVWVFREIWSESELAITSHAVPKAVGGDFNLFPTWLAWWVGHGSSGEGCF